MKKILQIICLALLCLALVFITKARLGVTLTIVPESGQSAAVPNEDALPVSAPETTRKVANQGAESTGPVAPASGDSVSSGVGAGETAPGAAQPASRARPNSRAVRVAFFIVADLLFLSSDAAGSFLFPPGKIPLTF